MVPTPAPAFLPLPPNHPAGAGGGGPPRIHISDDFDDPLPPDIIRSFEDPE